MEKTDILEAITNGDHYAGIDSRETPQDILAIMEQLAALLAKRGAILRSGGARGADSAFEKGTGNEKKKIYLPWRNFNNNRSPLHKYTPKHEEMAQSFHPTWRALSHYAKLLMTRNTAQIFGLDFQNPSSAVICWTKNAGAIGGTGQAIRMATAHNIPVLNLKKPEDLQAAVQFIKANTQSQK